MNKAYSRINFQNAPSTATPLNATNLNKMDKAINDLDDRIIELSGYQEEAQEAAEQASSSASAAAKAAETATADAEARVNAIIEGLEVYTKEESDKKFASVIKQVATGSPILIKDGTDAGALDFRGKGRSTQNGTPTPDNPIAIKSVADGGYFDGELLQGTYQSTTGIYTSNYNFVVCSKNKIPCKAGDVIKIDFKKENCISSIRYWNNGTYVSYEDNKESYIVPSGVNEFAIIMQDSTSSPITPSTVGHITVTINGKYALIVKSKGKNSLQNTATTQTINGVTFTVNDNGSVTVKGTLTAVSAEIALTNYIPLEDNTKYILSGCPDGGSEDKFYARIWTNNAYKKLATDIGNSTTFVTNFSEHVNYKAYICVRGLGVSYDTTFYPMIRKAEVTDDTYEPYKETVTYIPLNEPLRSSLDGTVTDEVSLTEVNRRFAEVVFDGSDDEVISAFGSTYPHLFVIVVSGVKKTTSNIICTHFQSYTNVGSDYSKNMIYTLNDQIFINHMDISTVDELKTWLQANPIRVIYELAEPIIETIEPVDIVTYNNVTYISNADNAEMEVAYATDTKSYIDSKFAELHAALVNML